MEEAAGIPAKTPDAGLPKLHTHGYAELCVTTNFTFLTGASHPEELVTRATELGLEAIAITDRNSLAGVVRAYSALRELKREADEAIKIRSQHRVDNCSRQEIGDPHPMERPEAVKLPKLIVGTRLVLRDSPVEWLALPRDRTAYARLTRLLTLGKRRAEKGDCHLDLQDLLSGCTGMILIALPPGYQVHITQEGVCFQEIDAIKSADPSACPGGAARHAMPDLPPGRASAALRINPADRSFKRHDHHKLSEALPRPGMARRTSRGSVSGEMRECHRPPGHADDKRTIAHIRKVARHFPGHVFLGAAPRYNGRDQVWLDQCAHLAHRAAAPMVAVGDVLMHRGSRRQLADVLTCMREHITIDEIGTRALPNAERRLKGADDMTRLFRDHPAAIRRTLEIAARCSFRLNELSYEYPDEISNGEAPQERLVRLTQEGLERRCPDGVPERYRAMAAKELELVEYLNFAAYFLTVHDIVQFARGEGILCQGRGSAANSILCYALGITDVRPDQIAMVFERFVSKYRGEPPDIDVDFEHERREEVIQHIYKRYKRHRAGLCATVIHFRSRAAIREVGKVMGLSQDVTASLSGLIWGMSSGGADPERIRELGLDLTDRRLAQTIELIGEIIGFPRHLSQHVGGFVITRGRLDELCPIENAAMEDRTVIEWDKDDIDALNILKVDVLGLGMLTCIRKAFELLKDHEGIGHRIDTIPQGDTATYDMLCVADAVGVFQVESRAQMNFLPRMKPREFYDLVIEVAIVRPGPIQGGMVQPYIKRRQGLEKPEPLGPELEKVMEKTLGVPLFQEHAMQIAVVAAGFTPEEADRLRRSLASFRRMGTIGAFRDRFIKGMLKNGYDQALAERCFSQIEGFADYGFPESHAAAFAMLVYVSAWLKCHHPAVFACALLNSQPMGFYAPAQIVRDAREHHVEIRPICVNNSIWDNTLERRADGALALRLGFRQIKGFKEEDAKWIAAARGNGYRDPESVWHRAGIRPDALERLAEADAFSDTGLTRRNALWQVKAIRGQTPLPLFNDPIDGEGIREPAVELPAMHLGEEVVEDYVAMRLSLRAHPMELLRPSLPGLTPHVELATAPMRRTAVCGLVITRQRPGTASGVIFLTLEDETGVSNVVVWPKVFQQYRRIVMGGRLLRVTGYLQREGIVVHLIAQKVEDLSGRLSALGHPMPEAIGQIQSHANDAPNPRLRDPVTTARHPREQAKKLFPSRDFH